jgi:hypothetical protein
MRDTQPKIGMAFVTESEALEQFQAMNARAMLIARCAEVKEQAIHVAPLQTLTGFGNYSPPTSSPGALSSASHGSSTATTALSTSLTAASVSQSMAIALVLYTKALQLFHRTINTVSEYRKSQGQGQQGQGLDSTSPRGAMIGHRNSLQKIDAFVKALAETFSLYMKKAEKLRERLKQHAGAVRVSSSTKDELRDDMGATDCAERVLHEWAVQLAQEAALDEMNGSKSNALKKYKRAYRVIEHLSMEEGVDEHDQTVLRRLMTDIWTRMEAIGKRSEVRSRQALYGM